MIGKRFAALLANRESVDCRTTFQWNEVIVLHSNPLGSVVSIMVVLNTVN